jgi:hypothetical protein
MESINTCFSGDLKKLKQKHREFGFRHLSAFNDWPFRYACFKGWLPMAKWMYHHGVDVRAMGDGALRWACRCNNFRIAKWLLRINVQQDCSINTYMSKFKKRRMFQLASYF